jgi:hypothetical protein
MAFVAGRMETVSFGYWLVISGVPSGETPAGGRPIFGFAVPAIMQLSYWILSRDGENIIDFYM